MNAGSQQTGLLSAIRAPAGIVDVHSVVLSCNIAFAKLLGYRTPRELVGQSLRKWIDVAYVGALERKLVGRAPFVLEDAVLTAVAIGNRPAAVFVPVDGGWLVQLPVPWSAGLAVSAEFPEFVAGVAHEINNPLAFAIPSLQEAAALVAAGDTDAHQLGPLLDQVTVGLDRIARVVNDLRTFRASDEAESQCDINKVVVETVRLIRPTAQHVRFSWDLGAVPSARGDQGPLGQVLLNLLNNAANVMSDAPGRPQNRVVVRTWVEGPSVMIQVSDNGPGIPDDIAARIFDPFVSRRAGGTGLGLTVCVNLVRAMGGEIQVESKEGEGTAFLVRLRVAAPTPSIPVAQPRESTPPSAAANHPQSGQKPLLVLIDDEPLVRRVLRRKLKPFEIADFGNGEDAVAWLEKGLTVHGIVCDRVMSPGDGEFVLTWIRNNRPQLEDRFVFITGAAPSARDSILGPRVFRKPFTADHLGQLVRWFTEAASIPEGQIP